MNEEKTVEVTPVETPTWNALIDEAVKLIESLGKAMVTTAQDLSNLMVIKTTPETREQLDQLVNAGFAETRRQAATAMIQDGLKTKQEIFDKVTRTNAQIAALKAQMRAVVGDRAS